jgi:hypothetical protein
MTYLRCDVCGMTAVRGRMSLVGSCPRCRLRGQTVQLTEVHQALSRVRTAFAPLHGGAPTRERGTATPVKG